MNTAFRAWVYPSGSEMEKVHAGGHAGPLVVKSVPYYCVLPRLPDPRRQRGYFPSGHVVDQKVDLTPSRQTQAYRSAAVERIRIVSHEAKLLR